MKLVIIMGASEAECQTSIMQANAWKQILLVNNPNLDISIYPNEVSDSIQITVLLVNKYPYGVLKKFPNAKAILVLAAGVDYVMHDPELPDIPIARLQDNDMAKQVAQYAATFTLNIIKRTHHWRVKQDTQSWAKAPPFSYPDKVVGVMGLGFMGGKIISMFKSLEINVIGWSRTYKLISDIKCYSGAELNEFLAHTDILICMLPLTPATTGILNLELFNQLKSGADIINIGRGGHLVEADLLIALKSGQLSSAVLDVFKCEPLPKSHPFWTHPKITITPHIASVSNPQTSVNQVLENINHIIFNQPLSNVISRANRY